MADRVTTMRGSGRAALSAAIERSGYFPALVADAVDDVLGDEEVRAHMVHQETTFDSDEVRRHVTVLALTPSRLIVSHTDDHPAGTDSPSPVGAASTEVVRLSALRSVVVNRVVPDPATYAAGTAPQEVVLTLCWGAVNRVDLEPASCGDPDCDADHGYTGSAGPDDLTLRVSAAAEGPDVVADAVAFARAVSVALSQQA